MLAQWSAIVIVAELELARLVDAVPALGAGAELDAASLARGYEQFSRCATMYEWYFVLAAVAILLCVLKTLDLLSFHRRVALLTDVFGAACGEGGHFAVVAAVLVFGYAFLGWQLFGPRVEQLHTFETAASSALFPPGLGEIGQAETLPPFLYRARSPADSTARSR